VVFYWGRGEGCRFLIYTGVRGTEKRGEGDKGDDKGGVKNSISLYTSLILEGWGGKKEEGSPLFF